MMMDNCCCDHWSLYIVCVHILMCRRMVNCCSADIRLFIEDSLCYSQKLRLVNMAVFIDIRFLEDQQQLCGVVSSRVTDSLEKVIEEPMKLSWLQSSWVINIVDSPYFINVFHKLCIRHHHFFAFLTINYKFVDFKPFLMEEIFRQLLNRLIFNWSLCWSDFLDFSSDIILRIYEILFL